MINIEGVKILAKLIHKGQYYGTSDYYEGHLLPIATIVWDKFRKKDMYIAALLHDAIEDTDITLDDLINLGIDMDTAYMIFALTRKPNEEYSVYIDRVKTNKGAREIKKIDLQFNLSNSPNKSLVSRYHKALEVLN